MFNSVLIQMKKIITNAMKRFSIDHVKLFFSCPISSMSLHFKAFGASERALECYNKADADLNLSRADVEKQRMNSNIKRQQVMTSV